MEVKRRRAGLAGAADLRWSRIRESLGGYIPAGTPGTSAAELEVLLGKDAFLHQGSRADIPPEPFRPAGCGLPGRDPVTGRNFRVK